MKKVLCLIDSLASGGAERQMSYLATGLKSRGIEVEVIVFSLGNDFFEEYISSRGVPVTHSKNGINPYRRIFEIIRLIRQKHPDAVIAYKDGVTMAACIARMLYKFRLIVSERNTTQVLTPYERRKFWLYRFADVIVPNSHSQEKFIREKYPNLIDKVHVITNTIDLNRFTTKKEQNHHKPLRIVTFARLFPQKNVLTFLDAVSLIKKSHKDNLYFDWYGSQEDKEYTDKVLQKMEELNLQDIITFHPATKDVNKIMAESDIFCLPSIYEGFPNVVCEAMAAGMPVVASRVSDIPYIIDENVNGLLFDCNDPSDIAEKIIKISEYDSNKLHIMSEQNREKVKALCSDKNFIDNYLSLI